MQQLSLLPRDQVLQEEDQAFSYLCMPLPPSLHIDTQHNPGTGHIPALKGIAVPSRSHFARFAKRFDRAGQQLLIELLKRSKMAIGTKGYRK